MDSVFNRQAPGKFIYQCRFRH